MTNKRLYFSGCEAHPSKTFAIVNLSIVVVVAIRVTQTNQSGLKKPDFEDRNCFVIGVIKE